MCWNTQKKISEPFKALVGITILHERSADALEASQKLESLKWKIQWINIWKQKQTKPWGLWDNIKRWEPLMYVLTDSQQKERHWCKKVFFTKMVGNIPNLAKDKFKDSQSSVHPQKVQENHVKTPLMNETEDFLSWKQLQKGTHFIQS